MIQDIEHKRLECNRLMRNKNKRKISKFLKTPEMIEQEAQQAKWKTSKVSHMPKLRLFSAQYLLVLKINLLRSERNYVWFRRRTNFL